MDKCSECLALLHNIENIGQDNREDIKELAISQRSVIQNYKDLIESYKSFVGSVSDVDAQNALQEYKKRELWVKVGLGALNVVSLLIGKFLPALFGGG